MKIKQLLLTLLLAFLVLVFLGLLMDIIAMFVSLTFQGIILPIALLIISGYFIDKLRKKLYPKKVN